MSLTKGIYTINGVDRMVISDSENETLADALRRIGLTSVKLGCGTGQCGSCTILMNGKPVRSCTKKMKDIPEFTKIETLEGLGTASNLHPLQRAWIKYGGAQCGFCTPGFIMSSKGLLDVNPDPTREEVRDWFTKNSNLCRCTGYKPIVDAVMAAAEVIRGAKPIESLDYTGEGQPEEGTIYNSYYPRPSALAKVMGVADFGEDISHKMPHGTLHMAVKLSDERHAEIVSINTEEAMKQPGVEAVLTAKDVKGTNEIGSVVSFPRSIIKNAPQQILCDKKVIRSGDAIAIVVADTREHAREAVKHIKVEYKKLPVYENYLEACAPGAVPIQLENPSPFMFQPVFKGEDTKPIFEKAENDPDSGLTVVEGSFYSSRQPHLAIEPETAQAYYQADGTLVIVYKSQAVHSHLAKLPAAIGVESDKLRLILPYGGGSFGSSMDIYTPALVGIAAVATGKNVSFVSTYAEKQLMTGKRAPSYANTRLACTKDGKIVAHEFDIAIEVGSFGSGGMAIFTKPSRFAMYGYNVPNIKSLCRIGYSNNSHEVAYRALGAPQSFTSGEQLIDMMAEKLGIDPFEMRYINIAREGETTNNGFPFKHYPLVEMMDRLRPDYEDALKWKDGAGGHEPARPGWKRGVGISIGGYHVSSPKDSAYVRLELGPDGVVTNYNSWEELGQGGDAGSFVETHEALKPLGITPDKIRLVQNDTGVCPEAGPAAGSRCHFFIGNAIKDAAGKMMDAMRKEDGTYRTYEEMVAEGLPVSFDGEFSINSLGFSRLSADTGLGDPMPDQNFIVNIARIEVEEATGKVEVNAIHSIADIGVVGNYLAVDGQAYSGLMHSLGYALSEDYSDAEKKYQTPLGCGFPRANDVPDDMTIEYLETPRDLGPFGSGGASECFQGGCHVCILNAISNAVGVRIYEIPARPEKIKEALAAKAEGREYGPEKYYLGRDFYELMDEIEANPVSR